MGQERLWRRFAVICAVSAVAVGGPLLDLYGRNPEVFVANRTRPWEMVVFGLLVALIVPLLSISLVALVSVFNEKAGQFTYVLVVCLLAIAAGLVIARQTSPEDMVVAGLIVGGVVGLTLALHRWAPGFLVLAGLALPVTLVLFLATSPASALIWEEPEQPAGSGQIANPKPIVFIQLDEMPAASIITADGEVNGALFPNFARLADEGTWYRNAFSNSIATTQSVPAILTGTLGVRGLSPSAIDHPDNLFTILGTDYEMHVIEWVADLCPEELCPDYAGRAPARFSSLLADVGVVYLHLSMPAPARAGLPSIDNSWKGFLGQGDEAGGLRVDIDGLPVPGPDVRVRWADWIERLANGITPSESRPVLSYAHLQAPHVPWVTNPSGTHYVRPEEYSEVVGVGGDGRWGQDPAPPLIAFQRHLYQVGMLDTMLGRLFARLDETGTWDETMIVVIADHGASFVPGQHRRWPYEENRDDLYRVPMFVKYPGQATGAVVDEPAFGIDLVPTIVDVLGVDSDLTFDGMSLRDIEGRDRVHTPVWWCCSRQGVETDLEILNAQVARNHTWIPDQSDWLGVAGVGAHAGLIGADVAALDIRQDEGFRWYLELGADLMTAERQQGVTQTYIEGRVELPDRVIGDDVVIVVNGVVAGMGDLTPDGPTSATFQAMVAEELLSGGPNEIDILLPGEDDIWVSGVNDDLTVALFTAEGRLLEIQPEGSRRLQVDRASQDGSNWVILGWAADINRKETPDTIYVFAAGELVAHGPPNIDNQNVVRWFSSDDLLRSGFEFEIPGGSIPDGIAQITVVAEFGDYAIGDETRLDLSSG